MSPSRRRTIMAVDNDPDMLELLSLILTTKGYQVFTEQNPVKALQFINEGENVDLFLVDIRMPQMSGLDLFERLKDILGKPRLIFISAFNDISVAEAYAKGACGFINKPFSNIEILAATEDGLKDTAGWTRKHIRHDIHLDVNFAVKDIGTAIAASTLNLGRGGMFIATDQLFEIGTMINFEIKFAEGEVTSFGGVGKVAWIRPKSSGKLLRGIGIMFLSIAGEGEYFITKYVKEKLINAFIPLGTRIEADSDEEIKRANESLAPQASDKKDDTNHE